MKRFATAALSLLVLGAMASPVSAQSDVGSPLGSLYVSTSPDSYEPILQEMALFTPYDIYVVVDIDFNDIGAPSQNLSNGIIAYEFSFTKPALLTLLSVDYVGGINIGVGQQDYIVGVGVPFILANSTPRPLITMSGGLFSPTAELPPPGFEMEINPASTQTVPGEAIWQEALTVNGCTNRQTGAPVECFRPFAFKGTLRMSTGIATDTQSFGGLKSSFDR